MTIVRHIIDPATGQAIFVTPNDPTAVGLDGPIGSLANLQGGARFFAKFGGGATDWQEFAAVAAPPVSSVFGRVGAVVGQAGDYTWSQVSGGHPTTVAGYGITDFNSLGDTRWAQLSGATFTGNVKVGNASATAELRIDGPAGSNRIIRFWTGGTNRWAIYADSTTESGSNAGSVFRLQAYDDAGATIDQPIVIARPAGGIMNLNRPVVAGAGFSSTVGVFQVTTTGAVSISGAGSSYLWYPRDDSTSANRMMWYSTAGLGRLWHSTLGDLMQFSFTNGLATHLQGLSVAAGTSAPYAITISGSATSGQQIRLATSSVWGVVGTRQSGGDTVLTYNASQTANADQWGQSINTLASTLLILRVTGLEMYTAPAGVAGTTFASFWGGRLFGISTSGVVTISGGLSVGSGTVTLPAGSVADAALSSNIPKLASGNTFLAAQAIVTPASGNYALKIQVTGDTVPRLGIETGGRLLWGPGGSSAADVTLVRTGTGAMTMTGTFSVSNGLSVTGDVQSSSGYIIGGIRLAAATSSYNQLYRRDGNIGIYLGGADATNYYDNDGHIFRNRASTQLITVDSSGNTAMLGTIRSLSANGLAIGNVNAVPRLQYGVFAAGYFSLVSETNVDSSLRAGLLHTDFLSFGGGVFIQKIDSGTVKWQGGNMQIRTSDGTLRGYPIYADSTGFGWLHSGGSWLLRNPYGTLDLIAGGTITGTNFILSSDVRLKQNLSRIESALDRVCALSGYTYELRKNPSRRRAGVLHHEVLQALPEAAFTDEDGYGSVDYTTLVPLLIEAVKELRAEVQRGHP